MTRDETRRTVEDVVAGWPAVHVERRPPRPARFADTEVHPLVASRLAERGITRLYRHQAEAIGLVRDGVHTVVATGTASGKSLCYQVPVAETALADPRSTSLLIHPTKALSQDQLRAIADFRLPELRLGVYDGDTPGDERSRLRRSGNVILTNPDMLHVGILPAHGAWADFFHRLRFVVVDEMHSFRGMFGTHVAFVLRRLRRIAAHYGAHPTFIFGSATIANPGDLAEALCGLPVAVVDDDASPTGARWTVLRNPPLVDPDGNVRRSALGEATDAFVELVGAGFHTIAFTRSRKATELVYRWSRDRLPADLAAHIAPYRAGYRSSERRETERRLFSGELAGVVATNALELGVDIGGLDAVVMTTFPGTISSFRQQAGRAGRRVDESVAVLVGGEDALDQYFMTHPAELFARPPESAVVNPANPVVAEIHAGCAAYELPLAWDDRDVLGDAVEEAANRLVQAGGLRLRDGRLHWARRQRPTASVDIRGGGGKPLRIVAGSVELGTIERSRAPRETHVGAIYLHQGDAYLVTGIDDALGEVRVERAAGDVYTEPREETDIAVLDEARTGRTGRTGLHLGRVRVTSTVVGYQRRALRTRRVIERVPLDPITTVLETEAVWFTLPSIDSSETILGALHAAEHAAIGLLPLLAVCDRWDVGGVSTARHPDTGGPTIFIHEAHPGGTGIAPVLFSSGSAHLASTRAAIEACPCADGCPSCVVSPKCGNFNEPLDKAGAVRLLAAS